MLFAGCVFAAAPQPAFAQTSYPTKPVRFVVPFAPGGSIDLLAREVAVRLGNNLGQQVIVENRGGAGGLIGINTVAKAPADGYTILFGSSHFAVAPSLQKSPTYDPVKDFLPVSLVAHIPLVLVVNPKLEVTSVSQLMAMAKTRPGGLNYGTSGVAGGAHLAGELFNSMAGVKLEHVPYKGGGPALQDLLGGQIQVMFGAVSTHLPHVRSGRLRALAWTGAQRIELLPDLPTIAESGLPGYSGDAWAAVFAPAGTPPEIVARLSDEVRKVVNEKSFRDKQLSDGVVPVGSSAEQLGAYLKSEIAKWAKVVKDANITAD